MSDWTKWDEFFNRLGKEIENRIREVLELPSSMLEPLVDGYRRPRADMTVYGGNVFIIVEMPGCDKERIEVNVDDSTLHVTGEYLTPTHPELSRLYPFKYGRGFRRSIQLPRPLDASKVEAKYEAGLLTIKAPVAMPKGVKVRIE